jgi:hypothetical protein
LQRTSLEAGQFLFIISTFKKKLIGYCFVLLIMLTLQLQTHYSLQRCNLIFFKRCRKVWVIVKLNDNSNFSNNCNDCDLIKHKLQ